MPFLKTFEGIRALCTRIETKVQSFLNLLSVFAVLLVVASEFLSPDLAIPVLNVPWGQFQVGLRLFIWLVFVVNFVIYALLSGAVLKYTRGHLLDLIICVAWLPQYQTAGVLRHLPSMLSLPMLLLIGSLAHAWRVARWTISRFNAHPLIVTGSAALVLIGSASVVLVHVEPQTFHNIWDAAWYCIVTITTIGYGDLVPHTALGRSVGVVVIISGISLAGIFIGLVSETVRSRLMNHTSGGRLGTNPLLPIDIGVPNDSNELSQQVLVELRKNNELLTQLLEELRRSRTSSQDQSQQPPAAGPDSPAD